MSVEGDALKQICQEIGAVEEIKCKRVYADFEKNNNPNNDPRQQGKSLIDGGMTAYQHRQAATSNHHSIAIAAINAYASTIQGKNLSSQEVSDKCAEVYRNTVANLNKISVDSDGKA